MRQPIIRQTCCRKLHENERIWIQLHANSIFFSKLLKLCSSFCSIWHASVFRLSTVIPKVFFPPLCMTSLICLSALQVPKDLAEKTYRYFLYLTGSMRKTALVRITCSEQLWETGKTSNVQDFPSSVAKLPYLYRDLLFTFRNVSVPIQSAKSVR